MVLLGHNEANGCIQYRRITRSKNSIFFDHLMGMQLLIVEYCHLPISTCKNSETKTVVIGSINYHYTGMDILDPFIK